MIIGTSQDFVLGQGFQEIGGHTTLIGRDGSRRLLAEISADPDRPQSQPQEAYQELLASLAPGWTVRLLQVTWPDPEPRQAFLTQVGAWVGSGGEELETLRRELTSFLEGFPLPYRRRTFLEFVLPPGNEGLSWWGGVSGVLGRYGLELAVLGQEEILALARHLLNPELE